MATEAEVVRLYNDGLTFAQIARKLRVRSTRIAEIADRVGLKRRRGAHTLPHDSTALYWQKVWKTQSCWLWCGPKNGDGYGRVSFWIDGKRKKKQAHHVGYFLATGKWPLYIMHTCDTPACCNPAHLKEGTHQENIAECWKKGRGHKGKNFEKLEAIRAWISAGKRNREICREFDIKNDAVSRIRHGRIYGERRRAEA